MDKQKPRCICSHRYLRAFDHWNRSHHWHNGRLHCSGFSLFETSLADTLKNHLSIMGTFLQPNSWCDFAGVCVCVIIDQYLWKMILINFDQYLCKMILIFGCNMWSWLSFEKVSFACSTMVLSVRQDQQNLTTSQSEVRALKFSKWNFN